MRSICLAVALGLVGAPVLEATEPASDTASARMFDRMRALAGDWEGTFAWSEGRTGTGPLQATYYLTGNGSALVENLIMGGAPSMTTIYHLDGADLRMTHYCAARNQPRFKASRIDESAGAIDFAFVDVTNVDSKHPAYVKACSLRLIDADQVALKFTFGDPSKTSGVENIVLKRVHPSKGSP